MWWSCNAPSEPLLEWLESTVQCWCWHVGRQRAARGLAAPTYSHRPHSLSLQSSHCMSHTIHTALQCNDTTSQCWTDSKIVKPSPNQKPGQTLLISNYFLLSRSRNQKLYESFRIIDQSGAVKFQVLSNFVNCSSRWRQESLWLLSVIFIERLHTASHNKGLTLTSKPRVAFTL